MSEAKPLTAQQRYHRHHDATKHLPPLMDDKDEVWFWPDEEVKMLRLACNVRHDEKLATESLFKIATTAIRIYKSRQDGEEK